MADVRLDANLLQFIGGEFISFIQVKAQYVDVLARLVHRRGARDVERGGGVLGGLQGV